MGLRNSKVTVPEEETATTEEQVEETAAQEEPAVEPKQAETTAVSIDVGGDYPTLISLKNKIDLAEVPLKRIVGSSGQLQMAINKTTKIGLGEWADVNILSYSDRWMVVPVKDASVKTDATKYCKASFDGETVFDIITKKHVTIQEYEKSIANVFPLGVGVQKYMDLVVMVLGAAKNGDKAQEQAVLQVSISPTSVRDFNQYLVSCPIRVMQGKVPATHQCCLRVTANQQTTSTGQDYVTMSFGAIPLEVVNTYKPLYM